MIPGGEDPLEGMATHSSILVWRVPMDRGAWWAAVHGVAQSWTWLQQLSSSSKAAAAFLQALCSVSPPICPWQITPSLPATHTCQWFPFPLEAKANLLPMASEGLQDPGSPTSSRTGFWLLLKPAKHVFLLGLLQA